MANAQNERRRIAIVTGGSRGMGRATVLALARRGVDSIFTYNSNAGEAAKVAEQAQQCGSRALQLQLDVTRIADFEDFASHVVEQLATLGADRFDYLVNNAGVSLHKPFAETTENDVDHIYAIHFKAVFFLTQKLLPLLRDGGCIINISSGLTRFTSPGISAYASMKGAIEVLSRYLAKELGSREITVNSVAPGAIATDFSGGGVRDNPELNRQVAAMTALGRAGLPDDVGRMIAALLSDDNHWVTGQRIEVSGGMAL